jgi:ApbE superfamily uncharacterized protein (UPF0280 family)
MKMSPGPEGGPVVRKHFQVGETAVTILAEEPYIPLARESIYKSREIIQRFIAYDPIFKDTLEPFTPPFEAHPLIRAMCSASAKARVGPMAAVAGAIAKEAVRAMVMAGARQAVVDNGGDIAMFLTRTLDIGLFAGTSSITDVGFRMPGERREYGACTSSGTVGPSISFGVADAAVVFAEDAMLADACATRLGNEVGTGEEGDMLKAIDVVLRIHGVDGALVVVGDRMAMRGKLPSLVKVKVPPSAISRIEI